MPSIKPEFFNYDMTRALLEGRKTVTRRLIRAPGHKVEDLLSPDPDRGSFYAFSALNCMLEQKTGLWIAPRHLSGDIIYVRESFALASTLPGISDVTGPVYMADFSPKELEELKDKHFRWKPSIHMPKEFARIFLRVTKVWPEHLRDITEQQAILEGISKYDIGPGESGYASSPYSEVFHETAINSFAELWNSTVNGPDYPRYGWLANPMVWAYEFQVISREDVCKVRGAG